MCKGAKCDCLMLTDDTALVGDSEGRLQQLVREFSYVRKDKKR